MDEARQKEIALELCRAIFGSEVEGEGEIGSERFQTIVEATRNTLLSLDESEAHEFILSMLPEGVRVTDHADPDLHPQG